MTRALVLRHHDEDHSGLIGEALEARDFEIDLRMMNEASATPSLDGYDIFVILGSKSAVYDREVEAAWFHREMELIAEAGHRDLPILGICFGAQALCLHHGGVVERSTEPEIGWYTIDAVNGSNIASGPWFEFHFDRCTLPADAQLWATSPRAVQAFAVGRNVGVQFHPEVDHVQLADWFAGGVEEARDFGIDTDALLAETKAETPAARERAADLVDLFLSHIAR
jgi:GMP synthase-like glutamine amidotransferase